MGSTEVCHRCRVGAGPLAQRPAQRLHHHRGAVIQCSFADPAGARGVTGSAAGPGVEGDGGREGEAAVPRIRVVEPTGDETIADDARAPANAEDERPEGVGQDPVVDVGAETGGAAVEVGGGERCEGRVVAIEEEVAEDSGFEEARVDEEDGEVGAGPGREGAECGAVGAQGGAEGGDRGAAEREGGGVVAGAVGSAGGVGGAQDVRDEVAGEAFGVVGHGRKGAYFRWNP